MIDLGKSYKAQCEAALDAFRKSLNLEFDRTTETVNAAFKACLLAISDADEQFMIGAEARVSGAGLAIANAVRQFVGEAPLEEPVAESIAESPTVKLYLRDHLDKAAE